MAWAMLAPYGPKSLRLNLTFYQEILNKLNTALAWCGPPGKWEFSDWLVFSDNNIVIYLESQ